MKKSSKRLVTASLAALATFAAVALSCTAITPGEPQPPGTPEGMEPTTGTTPTHDPTPETVTPTPGPAMPGGMDPLPVPGSTPGQTTPIETVVTPPTQDVLEAEKALQSRLDMLTAAVPGTKVRFIDCNQSPCTARLEGKSLNALRDLLASLSQDSQGKISFVVREQLDAYMGQVFYADVAIGADQPRSTVPTDPAELLAN